MRSFQFFTLAIITVVLGALVFGQSRPQTSGGPGKANKRPPASESQTKPESTASPEENRNEPQPALPADAIVDDEVLKVDTDLVTIPVKVLDRSGRFIPGLKKEDFKVFDEGAEKEIAYFSNEEQPFTVALVLDMSYSSTFKINEIQAAAIAFIAQLHPADKVMVVSFDEEVHMLSEATKDRERIRSAIRSTNVASGTSLYEAVDLIVNKRFKQMPGRKAIVLFTDGVDTTSRAASDLNNLSDVYELDALIYPIQYDTYADVQRVKNNPTSIPGKSPIPSENPLPFPLPIPTSRGTADEKGTRPEDYQKASEYLQEMAMRTGGRVYRATDKANLALAFSNIADELRQTYSLGIYPNEEEKGKRHKLKVKVSTQGAVVKARDTYVYKKKEKKVK